MEKDIETHIEKDKAILQDPTVSPQMRRHIEGELHDLEEYVENHKKKLKQEITTIQTIWNCSVIRILRTRVPYLRRLRDND